MAYAAGRHMTYNGKYYEKGQIVDVTAETLTRIESFIYTKTLVEVADSPKHEVFKSKKAKKESVVEAAPVIVEEPIVEEQPVVEPVVEEEPAE